MKTFKGKIHKPHEKALKFEIKAKNIGQALNQIFTGKILTKKVDKKSLK